MQDARSQDRHPSNFTLDCVSDHSFTKQTYIYICVCVYVYIYMCGGVYIYIYVGVCMYVYICVCVCVCVYTYVRWSLNKFPDFFVWALLLIVHTWDSSPLQSNLLWLQCTCTISATSGNPHGSLLVWACVCVSLCIKYVFWRPFCMQVRLGHSINTSSNFLRVSINCVWDRYFISNGSPMFQIQEY